MTSTGVSTAPLPPEIREVLFVQRMGWTWAAYVTTPTDVLHRYSWALSQIDAAHAALDRAGAQPAMPMYAMDDSD